MQISNIVFEKNEERSDSNKYSVANHQKWR